MAKKIYIGAEKQFTITNLLGACDDVGNRGAGEVIFVNNSIFKTGSQSWIFIPSSDATEVTYMLRQNASTLIKPHLIPSHKYYFSAWLQQLTPSFGQGSFDFYWPVQEPVFLSGAKPDKANEWCLVSAIKERSAFAEGDYECRVDWNDAKANLGMFFDGLTLVDLTAAFGAGNEPDQAWCDANIPFTKTTATVSRGTAHNVKNMFIGVSGKARKVKKAYVGVGGKARLFYTSTLPPAIVDLWNNTGTATTSYNNRITCITYANGYWVVGGQYTAGELDNKVVYARIAYATSLSGPWTIKDLWGSTSQRNGIGCIAYANGYWVVGGQKKDSTYVDACIAYATSLDGTWTNKTLWSRKSSGADSAFMDDAMVTCIAYGDGYWVAGGTYRYNDYYARIAYATSLSGAWTTKDVWEGNLRTTLSSIAYGNGYWVVGGLMWESSIYYPRIGYTTDPSGEWVVKDMWECPYRSNGGITCITYADGYWVIGGQYTDKYENGNARILYAIKPDGAWTTKDLWEESSGGNSIQNVIYADGRWVISGLWSNEDSEYVRIAYATSPSGAWTTKNVCDYNTYQLLEHLAYGDGYWAICGRHTEGDIDYASIAYTADLSEFDQI